MRHFAIPEGESPAAETELAVALGDAQLTADGGGDIVPVAIIALDRNGSVLLIPVPIDAVPYGWRP